MSTERKPGSRGVRTTSSPGQLKPEPPVGGNEPVPRNDKKTKGSTKTASPRQGFKKRK